MLTTQQMNFIESINNSNDRVFLLQGSAGTGKTYTIANLVKNYSGSVLVTATTHKAKSLLESKLGIKCHTIHSVAGFNIIRAGYDEYLTKVREPLIADLLIIDEYSMLTNDILEVVLDSPYKKIILVGDNYQLPAIGIKAKLPSNTKIFTLTKNIRQGEDKELEKFLNTLREYIDNKRLFPIITINKSNRIILYDNHKDFCNAYLDCENSKRILAYSNRVVDSYNLNINSSIKFKIGDLLIIDKPLGSARNGDIVEVVNINEFKDYYKLIVGFNEFKYEIYVYKTKSNEEKDLENYKNNLTDYWILKDKTYHPKHLFATTIHKAQGSSIDEVFIDYSDIYAQLFRTPSKYNNYNKPISLEEFTKLLYVAITRMSLKAHLFIGNKRNYQILKKRREMKLILENRVEIEEYIEYLDSKDLPKPTILQSLKDDIESEILKPSKEFKEIKVSPFEKKRFNKWTDKDIESIRYCASSSTPKSHRQLSYLYRILPNHFTESSIRNKIRELGFRVKKGEVCQKT